MNNDFIEILFCESTAGIELKEKSFNSESILDALLKEKSVQVPKQLLKNNISEALNQISELFLLNNGTTNYVIDEIEFGISIGAEGKVSILSVVGGGLSSNATLVIKLKRKEVL